jgi:drug/metabolite transporter (DMT)-like permease
VAKWLLRWRPFAAMAWQLFIGAVPLFLLSRLVEPQTAIRWSVSFILSLGILAVFGTALVFVLWVWPLRVDLSASSSSPHPACCRRYQV